MPPPPPTTSTPDSKSRYRHVSPDPELANGAVAKAYRHDPYSYRGTVFLFDDADCCDGPLGGPAREDAHDATMRPPAGTLHPSLWGRVSFVPYPTAAFRPPTPPAEGAELVRVFFGQLPYFVTDEQLSWLCYTFGDGSAVAFIERITKKQSNGERLPTGCVHAYATPAAVYAMEALMHKLMLIDDTGVWHAQSDEEYYALKAYVGAMKADRSKRVQGRPYDSVVVQLATSTYRGGAPRDDLVSDARGSATGSPAPPPPPPGYVAPPSYAFALQPYPAHV
jgi:hypothetical protein